jgi:hypothetical protein
VLYVFLAFLSKWFEERRFPHEEFRIRWWIAALGIVTVLALGGALIVTWMS